MLIEGPAFAVPCNKAISPISAGPWDTHLHTFDPVKHPYERDSPYFLLAFSVESALARLPADNFLFLMAMPEGTRPATVLESVLYMKSTSTVGGRRRQARATIVLDFVNTDDTQLRALHRHGMRLVR